ncbi:MAG: hypothetical protein PHH77_07030 [Victivallaceae bacterium]|nr:hypothetical protein [Victivallaceae bacterium]
MQNNNFDWDRQAEIWEKWWRRELRRPLFQITVPAVDEMKPPVAVHHFLPMYDFSVPAEDILKEIRKIKESKSGCRDASYPHQWINFGPGVLAALIGGEGRCGEGTVWFEPGRFEKCDISAISVKLDYDSKWFRRLEEFFIAASRQLGGRIQIGQTDIGGTLDVLSSLRPGEQLMFDMYDSPDEVKRLTWEIHEAWFEMFDYFNALRPRSNHGYSAWLGLLSRETHYVVQCDFSYMISPEQFQEFVLPELAASCRRLARPFYHLDGKGQLGHLDHLLSIPELVGIQWGPGAGVPDCSHWPEVYEKITAAGRLAHVGVTGTVEIIEKVLTQTDHSELMLFAGYIRKDEEARLNEIYRRYGIEPV